MAIQPKSNGLITENAQQYYQGSQGFRAAASGVNQKFVTDFNTELILGDWNPANPNYGLNNFKVYTSPSGISGSWSEWITSMSVGSDGRTINLDAAPSANAYVVVQLTILTGGKYGNTEAEKAYGETVEDNYGSYQYTKVNDVINNFLVAYVGQNKLIPNVNRTDVIFHAKRAMQEFSYDTLKSIKSAELTMPASLTLVLPQDFVNYVKMSYIDQLGVKHPIYPTDLSIRPQQTLIQDNDGIPVQDNQGTNTQGNPSKTNERWDNNQIKSREELYDYWVGLGYQNGDWPQGWGYPGQQYGLDTTLANINGYYMIDQAFGKISFSNDLTESLIVLEYISDGLAYEEDMKIPKMAEEAMYAHISHAIVASRIGQPEYIVQRLKRERSAKLRNAKLRLSNIKPIDIIQAFRGKSKWIKH